MGALLTGLGFRQVALAGAGIFIVALVVLFFCLPAAHHSTKPLKILPSVDDVPSAAFRRLYHRLQFVAVKL